MQTHTSNRFKILQHLSMDVVVGSISMGVLAVRIFSAEVPVIWWIILPLCVWVIYTLDHLLDATKFIKDPTIPRHLFHRQHAKKLISWVAGLAITAFVLTLIFLPVQIIVVGILLSSITLLYFISLRILPEKVRKWIPKEMIIAGIYVGGIFFVPWWFSNEHFPLENRWLIPFIILLVWCEGIMTAWFERENDIWDGHHSFATIAGKSLTKKLVAGMLSAILTGLIYIVIRLQSSEILANYIVLITINSGLLFIICNSAYFEKNGRYRSWGEVLFILPAVLLLV